MANVIAEIGSSHDGDSRKLERLITAAHEAGCDAVKLQYCSDGVAWAARRRAPEYADVYCRYAIPLEWVGWARSLVRRCGMVLAVSTYIPGDPERVAPWADAIKVASFEAADAPFVGEVSALRLPVIISTGMMTQVETCRLLASLEKFSDMISLLHCISAYPCPPEQAGLGGIGDLRSAKNFVLGARRIMVGYSDHTADVLTGALAVAAGAELLEVHVRLDDTDPVNPDYPHSLPPARLSEYVALVRKAEVMLGGWRKEPQACETAMMRYRVGT